MVYIREAHALDGAMPMGGGKAPLVEEPLTLEERKQVARSCCTALELSSFKLLVDDMQDSTGASYAGWPDRLYLVDEDGLIAFAGERGPRGFKPDELEDAIREELGLPAREQPKRK